MNEEATTMNAEFEEVSSEVEMNQLELNLSAEVGTIEYGDITNLPSYIHSYLKALMPEIECGIVPPGAVTKENVADAKKTLADLRKLEEKLEDERKRIKGIWNEPYDRFEKEYKEKTGLLDAAITNLAKQVKDIETADANKKRAQTIADIKKRATDYRKGFDTLLEQYPALWKKVWKDSYANKSTSTSKTVAEYTQALLAIHSDLKTIEIMDNRDSILQAYYRTGSLGEAIHEAEEYKARQIKEAQFKAQAEAEKEARTPQPTPAPAPSAPRAGHASPAVSPSQPEPGDIVKVFKVWHKSKAEFHGLIEYMKAHGFHAEVIKK